MTKSNNLNCAKVAHKSARGDDMLKLACLYEDLSSAEFVLDSYECTNQGIASAYRVANEETKRLIESKCRHINITAKLIDSIAVAAGSSTLFFQEV